MKKSMTLIALAGCAFAVLAKLEAADMRDFHLWAIASSFVCSTIGVSAAEYRTSVALVAWVVSMLTGTILFLFVGGLAAGYLGVIPLR